MEKRRIVRSAAAWCASIAMIANSTTGFLPEPDTANVVNAVTTITPGNDENKTGTGQMQISLKIKKTPSAGDFTFTAPTDLMYDGQPKEATVTAKDTAKGMGDITVEYYSDETKLDSAPSAAGTYTVKIKTAEGTEYKAADGITADSWTYTIHGHDFYYSANGAVITADCQGTIGE